MSAGSHGGPLKRVLRLLFPQPFTAAQMSGGGDTPLAFLMTLKQPPRLGCVQIFTFYKGKRSANQHIHKSSTACTD